jgi:hypothetical protein
MASPAWSITTPRQESSSPATFRRARGGHACRVRPGRLPAGRRAPARLHAPAGVSDAYAEQALAAVSRSPRPEASCQGPTRRPAGTGRPLHAPAGRLYLTHGHYQPRNWVIDDGQSAVIGFGRGQDRSWVSDLVRLRNQQFTGHPERERAFMAGLGRTVEDQDAELLAIESLRQSLGAVIWAHGIGDYGFAGHGRTMITRLPRQGAYGTEHMSRRSPAASISASRSGQLPVLDGPQLRARSTPDPRSRGKSREPPDPAANAGRVHAQLSRDRQATYGPGGRDRTRAPSRRVGLNAGRVVTLEPFADVLLPE